MLIILALQVWHWERLKLSVLWSAWHKNVTMKKQKKRKYLEVKNKNIWSSIKWENLVSFSCYHDHDKEDEA